MARIPYPHPADDATAQLLSRLPPLNVVRMMAGTPGMAGSFLRLGDYLLNQSKLDPILREIAILRIGHLAKASYEVTQHEQIARKLGISDDILRELARHDPSLGLNELESSVVKFTDAVANHVRVSDEMFHDLLSHLGEEQLKELVLVVGYYMMVARFLEVFQIEIEDRPVF